MIDAQQINSDPQSSNAGERKRISPDVLTTAVQGKTELLLEDIGSLPPEAQLLALQNLQAKVEASLAALGSQPKKMEATTEVLTDRETYAKLVGEYRRIAPDGNLNWNQILKQSDEKVLDTWRILTALSDFILAHREMLSANFKSDYGEEFNELVGKISGYATWAKGTKDHSELPDNNYNAYNVRSQAIEFCEFAADPLNFPEEQKSAPHVQAAIERLRRETRPDVHTVKVLSAEKIIEERARIQRTIDAEVKKLNELLATSTQGVSDHVYRGLQLQSVRSSDDLELVEKYIKDAETSLTRKALLERVNAEVKRQRNAIVSRFKDEPDAKEIGAWINKKGVVGTQIHIQRDHRTTVTKTIDEKLLAEVSGIRSSLEVVQDQLAQDLTWKQLADIERSVYSLERELSELSVKEAEYSKIPLIVDVKGYYYGADRVALDQQIPETDLTAGKDKVLMSFDTFVAGFAKMDANPLLWREYFSRDKKAGMDALSKMIFLGMTIKDDNVSSNRIHEAPYSYNSEGFTRVRNEIPEEENSDYRQMEQKALGFLIGRKIAKKDRSYVPPNFNTNFAKVSGSREANERVSDAKLHKIAEEFYDEWMKVNGQN